MRAILVGAVESSRVALEAIASAPGWRLPLVLSLPTELGGRHSDFVDLSEPALAAGAEFRPVRNINDPDVLSLIRAADADYVFVIGWSQICRGEFQAAARDRVIGYHPAALPRLRGRGVIPWTIIANEPITAGTLFWIDDGVDSGPILEQAYFHVAPDETAASLYARHMAALKGLMPRALASLAAGSPPRQPQDERFASWAARRTPEDGLIGWAAHAGAIERLIRASGRPYPGAYGFVGGRKLIIWKAEIDAVGVRHLAAPGQVIARDTKHFTVACGGNTALRILDWDLEGGDMPAVHARLGGKTE
jgi:methionyl-tRNA formyltransferase